MVDGKLAVELGGEVVTTLAEPEKFVGYLGDGDHPTSVLLRNNGLHVEIEIDPTSPIGKTDGAGVKDVVLGLGDGRSTRCMDFEDSVAAVDADDKGRRHRTGWGSTAANLSYSFDKGGKTVTAHAQRRPHLHHADGEELTLHGRSLLFVRNVGHLMTNPAILDADGNELPEGILDALITSACAIHGLSIDDDHGPLNESRTGSIYIVKPKQHGPEEVAFTTELFGRVEEVLVCRRTPSRSASWTRSGAPPSTPRGLHQGSGPAGGVFINTGFPRPHGDEIHTSMEAGAMVRKADMRSRRGSPRTRTGTSTPASRTVCRAMLRSVRACGHDRSDGRHARAEDRSPRSGANTAWVPSPTGATLHATHYHQVDGSRPGPAEGQAPRDGRRDPHDPARPLHRLVRPEKQQELDNNCQSILGYVVRWIDAGVGCSKVPDIHDVALMRTGRRCASRASCCQLAAARHRHRADVVASLERMAPVVDRQNEGDASYRPMAPDFDSNIAFQAAKELILEGGKQPSGYTEPILHRRRREYKAANA